MTGDKLLTLAAQHVGEPYVFGALAPKNQVFYKGPWDCAEFASYVVFQVTGRLYGCADNHGDAGGADAYSGFWDRDARLIGKKVTTGTALLTPGACLLRVAAKGLTGHIVFSDGEGGTIEAHSTKRGVIRGEAFGRRWDYGVLIPWVRYAEPGKPSPAPSLPPLSEIFRYTLPMMRSPAITKIQRQLKISADGVFGRQTYEAVRAFQARMGLVVDGEVGPHTAAALFNL